MQAHVQSFVVVAAQTACYSCTTLSFSAIPVLCYIATLS